MVRSAEAYKEQRVIRAQGDATKFLDVLKAYRKAKEVTRERLYLETLDKVLPGREKYILPPEGKGLVLKAVNLLQEPYEMMFHTVFHPAGMEGI
jgi:membrane protease subunit HflK